MEHFLTHSHHEIGCGCGNQIERNWINHLLNVNMEDNIITEHIMSLKKWLHIEPTFSQLWSQI